MRARYSSSYLTFLRNIVTMEYFFGEGDYFCSTQEIEKFYKRSENILRGEEQNPSDSFAARVSGSYLVNAWRFEQFTNYTNCFAFSISDGRGCWITNKAYFERF